jgi:pimeloyl-ACP methyl ester carboxylesterase
VSCALSSEYGLMAAGLIQTRVAVCADPRVELLVAQSAGPADRALLVIHGGPDWDHSYLREPLAEIGDRYRLVMPDLRGCGRSTCGLPADQYTPDAAVADLIALLSALGLDRVDVLGFSYGGLLAQRLALAAPAAVRRLIVASSSILPVPADAFDHWPERAARLAAETAVWSDRAKSGPDLVRSAAEAGAPANVWRADCLPGYLDRLAQVHFTGEWIRPERAGILPEARPPDADGRLAKLRVPVLVLHGLYDMTFPSSLAVRAAAAIPGAVAVVLDDAGHMAHVDQPSRWLHAIVTFLAGT